MSGDARTCLSFFSGSMGLDLGLEQAGLDVRACCENDPSARDTIRQNRPDVKLWDDVSLLDAAQLLAHAADVFLVAGGPPCQAFSTAGKRRSFSDARGNVFLKFIELATAIHPPYILIENVRGLLSAPMGDPSEEPVRGGALRHVVALLEAAHYAVSFNLYNTANFGVPQCRERVILIASLRGRVPFLTPTHADLPEWRAAHALLPWCTFREATAGLTEAHHVHFSERHLKYYAMLGPGQNWRDLPPDVQREALGGAFESGGGRTGFYRRLAWDQPSPTLVTSPAMPATALAHPELPRPLSVEEYKRLQCFPDDWVICGSLQNQYRQLGNAVPVKFGHAVGRAILTHFVDGACRTIDGFPFSRYSNTSDIEWRQQIQDSSRKRSKRE